MSVCVILCSKELLCCSKGHLKHGFQQKYIACDITADHRDGRTSFSNHTSCSTQNSGCFQVHLGGSCVFRKVVVSDHFEVLHYVEPTGLQL